MLNNIVTRFILVKNTYSFTNLKNNEVTLKSLIIGGFKKKIIIMLLSLGN